MFFETRNFTHFFVLYILLPANDLPRCNAGDTVCIPKVMNEILNNYPNGHLGLRMPRIEPLHIDRMEIWRNLNSLVVVNVSLNHLDMFGPSKTKILRVV